MQNKANFRKVKFNVTNVLIKDYDQMDTWSIGTKQSQTNPIQTQFKPNTKPIQSQYKANSKPIQSHQVAVRVIFVPLVKISGVMVET
jgi:hypothetical protein